MAPQPDMTIDASKRYQVVLTTDRGDITMVLDPALAPVTVNNFVTQARAGFYDGLTFHRVVPGFVVQGGDPMGTGTGDGGYKFADEPVRAEYILGAVAMANAGPNTNGTQFFICIDDCTGKLEKLYNLFGFVTDGIEVAQSIQKGDTMTSVTVTEKDD
jgi:cyclophilin family peptidyl-prolyl cis-trans isomerase